MITTRLAIAHLFSAFAAGVCLAIGARLLQRRGDGADTARRAITRYAVWWLALGADSLVNTVTWLAGELGYATPALTTALTYLALACVTVMLWGLLSYLLYLFTGRAGALTIATVLYAIAFLGGLALIVTLRPTSVTVGTWGGAIAYAREPAPLTALLFAIAFILPPLLGALAYGTLWFRMRDRDARYRIALVSVSIAAWFAFSLVGGAVLDSSSDAVAVARMAIPILALYLTWIAYSPPAFVQRLVGVQPGGLGTVHRPAAPSAASREEFLSRVRDLV